MREALTRYGIAVGVGSTEQLAAAIRAKPEPVRGQLLAALDEWRFLAPPIGMSFRSEADRILVQSILPGSPADRDGRLKTGDQIVGVGQGQEGQIVDVRPKTMPEGLALLRGASGTMVRLQVIPQGETEPRIFAIQRDPTAAWIRSGRRCSGRGSLAAAVPRSMRPDGRQRAASGAPQTGRGGRCRAAAGPRSEPVGRAVSRAE